MAGDHPDAWDSPDEWDWRQWQGYGGDGNRWDSWDQCGHGGAWRQWSHGSAWGDCGPAAAVTADEQPQLAPETAVAADEQQQAHRPHLSWQQRLAVAAELAIQSWPIPAPQRAIIQMRPQSRSHLGFIPETAVAADELCNGEQSRQIERDVEQWQQAVQLV